MRRLLVASGLTFFGLALAIQLVPVDRSNPPVTADLAAPPAVDAVLRASCYDCHSNETRWPWYSRVAPVSWLVAHDVEEARDHFNFSLWGTYERKRQQRLAEEMWEEVEDGEMPLRTYLLAHPDARLSDDDRAMLAAWSAEVSSER
ncbi:MAG TPA: heme-binding domain-containing protein [Chondromyces sp.]|nr:heme-binding domain-containing protein [Chondromyces sp.]